MKGTLALFWVIIGSACAAYNQDESAEVREIAFSCTNRDTLSVRFDAAASVATLIRNGASPDRLTRFAGRSSGPP